MGLAVFLDGAAANRAPRGKNTTTHALPPSLLLPLERSTRPNLKKNPLALSPPPARLDFVDGSIQQSLQSAGVTAGAINYWTGATATGALDAANCAGFTSTSGNGAVGGSASTSAYLKGSGGGATLACTTALPILCVAY